MGIYEMIISGADVLLAVFSVYLLIFYLDIFFERRELNLLHKGVFLIFFIWQLIISSFNALPGYINICITIGTTLVVAITAFNGNISNKCVFILAFNAIWMMTETLCGYVFMNYFGDYLEPQVLGSVISKMLLLSIILALKKVFTLDDVRELPLRYSIMLVMIPIGSIYIVNNIFMLSNQIGSKKGNTKSLLASVILLFINALIFSIYLRLTDELQLKRNNALYEQQLELCDKQQKERELSMLQIQAVRHNMKNSLISILAYAENGECSKIIKFVGEIMEDGALIHKEVSNTGNIVIDSLVNYWASVAQRSDIEFSVKLNIPIQMPFKGADLCLILGNVLENAVEAAKDAEGKRYIHLNMKYDKENLLIFILNSFNGHLEKTKEGRLKSTRKDVKNHGTGLESVYRTVRKYNGTVLAENSEDEFLLKILLYDPKE